MAYDFCKLTMCGRLVADPRRGEVNGKTVLNCRMAASVGFGDNAQSTFVSFALWDKLADAVADKLSKGDRVLIHGDLVTREYTVKDEKRTDLELRYTDSFCLLEDTRGREDTGERPQWGQQSRGRGGPNDWPDQRNDDFRPPGQGRSGGGFPGRR